MKLTWRCDWRAVQSLLALILYFQQVRVQRFLEYSLGSMSPPLRVPLLGSGNAKSSQVPWPPSHQAHSSLPSSINSTQGTKMISLIENGVNFMQTFCRKKKKKNYLRILLPEVTACTQNIVDLFLAKQTQCVIYSHLHFSSSSCTKCKKHTTD